MRMTITEPLIVLFAGFRALSVDPPTTRVRVNGRVIGLPAELAANDAIALQPPGGSLEFDRPDGGSLEFEAVEFNPPLNSRAGRAASRTSWATGGPPQVQFTLNNPERGDD